MKKYLASILCSFGLLVFMRASTLSMIGQPGYSQEYNDTVQTDRPSGVDLDVTFIERDPLYFAYCVEYPNEIPSLCPGTENDKRWPEPGEEVTFTAHIANNGTVSSLAFSYEWTIDGSIVHVGILPGLNPNEETTAQYSWTWDHNLEGEHALGRHAVGFRVDPDDLILETHQSNNWLEDDTLAMSFRIVFTPEMKTEYDIPVTPECPWSAEDWIQKQVRAMNENFARSIYPTTPKGATQRVRIDKIEVLDAYPMSDLNYDGGWFIADDVRHGASAWYDPVTDIDWAMVHELSHQVGMIDLYMSNIPYDNVEVLDQHGRPVNFGYMWRNAGLMGGGDITPYTDGYIYSSHSAAGVSTQRGYRNGYYGVYQYDVPLENYLQVLDRQGNPAAGVQVELYHRNGPLNFLYQPTIDNKSEIIGITGSDGRFLLPNRLASGGTVTKTGHTLRDNPFGVIDIIHTKNRFLGALRYGNHEEFFWLDITDFNLAYWSGDTEEALYQIASHIPVSGAPLPPTITNQRVEANRASLCWQASPSPGIDHYRVYRAERWIYSYHPISPPVNGLCYEDIHIDDAYTFGGYIYAVTAVDQDGKESGFSDFAWAGNLGSPLSLVIRPDGNAVVLDPQDGYKLLRQDTSGRYLEYLGFPDSRLFYSKFIGQDIDGNLLVSSPGSMEDINNHTVLVLDAGGNPLLEFGAPGMSEGQLKSPAGITGWGPSCSIEGPYQDDPQTDLLVHFDGSYLGSEGETGVPSGTSFTSGRYGQAVQIGVGEQLIYPAAGNLSHLHGSVEFWIKPSWDGDDEESYTLFEAGSEWYNRFRIMKDGANNLRFMVWDSAAEYGVARNISGWVKDEWHHVAATWQADQIALFVDGKQVGKNPVELPDVLPDQIYIGSSLWNTEHARAVVDEVRISSVPRIGNSLVCSHILVVDSENQRVQAFDSLGNFVSAFGEYGSGPGQFNEPQGAAVDSLGRVWVTDTGNQRVVVLGFDGRDFTFLDCYTPGFRLPYGLAIDNQDRVYIADAGTHKIYVLRSDGLLFRTFDKPNDGYTGAFYKPYSVGVRGDGTIVVADTGNRRVVTIQNPQIVISEYLPVVAWYE